MNDGMEDRIAKSFGHLAPEDGLRERVLGSLPAERATSNPWRTPLSVAASLLIVAAVVVAAWPAGGGGTSMELANVLGYHTDGVAHDVAAIMEKRLEVMGAPGDNVLVGEEPGRIWVTLPPELDPADVEATLLRPGTLEFRIVIEDPNESGGRMVDRTDGGPPMLVRDVEGFTGADIDPDEVRAQPLGNPSGPNGWVVAFGIVKEQRKAFATFTRENVNRYLAIIIDGRVEAAPRIASELPGTGIISGGGPGGFTREEAESLAAVLISGAYPAESRPR